MSLTTTKLLRKEKKEKTTSHSVHLTETGIKSILLTSQPPHYIQVQGKNKVYEVYALQWKKKTKQGEV